MRHEIETYISTLAEACGYSLDELRQPLRSSASSLARHLIWRDLYATGLYSYEQLAWLFNRANHATVMSGIRSANNLLDTNYELAIKMQEQIDYVKQYIYPDFITTITYIDTYNACQEIITKLDNRESISIKDCKQIKSAINKVLAKINSQNTYPCKN